MELLDGTDRCPTPIAHRRLAEAHAHWHSALQQYQDPEMFRIALNSCIQALRNTTFGLQKDKRRIDDFDNWYSTHQEQLKNDKVMKWVHDSRNRIVKSEDLETKSIFRAWFVATYDDAAHEVLDGLPGGYNESDPAVSAAPSMTIPELLEEIAKQGWPRRLVEQSTLSIERRWIARDLPDRELLDGLAYAYGFLWRIVWDAHQRIGIDMPCTPLHEHEYLITQKGGAYDGRLRCMVTSRKDRVLSIKLEDGKVTRGGKSWLIEYDPDLDRQSRERYKMRRVRLDVFPTNVTHLVPIFIEKARSILLAGEDHAWMVLYYKRLTMVGNRILMARNSADKRQLAQQVAEEVAANRIDSVVEIGEAWKASFNTDDEGYPLPAAESPDREEALVIHAETASGDLKCVHIPFRRRRFGRPKIEDPIDFSAVRNNFLEPTRAVWKSWQG